MLIIPAIDIREGRTVRLQQGDPGRTRVYDDDPVRAARRWVERGATYLHVVDLDGAFAGRPVHLDLLARICALGVPVQTGGGFRTLADVERGLLAGAARIVVGTTAAGLADDLGSLGERIAVSLDAREGHLMVRGWTERTDLHPAQAARALAARGIRRFVYTDVGRDGMLAGPDVAGLRAVVEAAAVPVIAAGGIASADDLAAVASTGVEGAIIGRALYEGRIDLRETIERWSALPC